MKQKLKNMNDSGQKPNYSYYILKNNISIKPNDYFYRVIFTMRIR